MQKSNKLIKGIFLALLTAVISGIAIFYSKISVAKIDPLVLTTARNSYVGILFFILLFVSFRRSSFGSRLRLKEIKKIKKTNLITLFLIGVIGGALPFYLFFTGLQYVNSAIIANTIHKTLFIWVSLLSLIFLREKFNLTYFLSYLFIFLGNFYFAKFNFTFGRGELMIFVATLLWSAESIFAKRVLKTVSSKVVGLFRMGIGSILLLVAVIFTGKGQALFSLSSQQLTIVFIGGTILFFYVYTWHKALKYAPASLVTAILVFSTVVGNILNGSFAGIKILPKDILTSVFITVGIFLLLINILFKKLRVMVSSVKTDAETSSA